MFKETGSAEQFPVKRFSDDDKLDNFTWRNCFDEEAFYEKTDSENYSVEEFENIISSAHREEYTEATKEKIYFLKHGMV